MKHKNRSERGQALILIVFAIFGLIALTALAVDGGNVYAERRRAQNAADSSALSAALAKVRGNNLYTAGLDRAASNNYTDDDPTDVSSSEVVNVEIYNPPIDYMGANEAYIGNSEYVQVVITTEVSTYFGRILGITTVTNKVMAIARGKPPVISPMALGNAIVGLSPECQALTAQGGGGTTVTGGGMYANGEDCTHDTAFFNNSGSTNLTTPCLEAAGGATYTGGVNFGGCLKEYGDASDLPDIVYPNPVCTGAGSSTPTATGATLGAGTFSGEFPPVSGNPNQTIVLSSGVYCVDEFDVNAQTTVIGSEVVIVLTGNANATLNGSSNITLTAPTSGPFTGLLLFAPESNSCSINLTGSGTINMTGTILAPSCDVTLNGTSGGTFNLSSQIIGYNVNISGNATMNLNYNAGGNYQAPIPPQVELVQ